MNKKSIIHILLTFAVIVVSVIFLINTEALVGAGYRLAIDGIVIVKGLLFVFTMGAVIYLSHCLKDLFK